MQFMQKLTKPDLASKRMLLATILLIDLLIGMELDLFVPSFPELQNVFNLTPAWVEASLSINFLGYCVSLFLVGLVSDRYNRKYIILIGLIIFIIGSLLCVWAPFYTLLLIGRFLQGSGIAAPAILSFVIIADTYPLKKQQYYTAMLNGLKNAAVAAAPVMGSYITLYFHWQGNFAMLLFLGIIALLMTLAFIPSYKPKQKESFSSRGYLPLFQSKPMILLMSHVTFLFVPYWIFVGVSPLLYMDHLGVPLSQFGYYQGGLALAFALGSVGYGLIINKFDHKKTLLFSNQILIASFILIAYLSWLDSTYPLAITLALLLFVIAQIIPSALVFPLCINYMPEAKGRTSGVVNASSLIFQALGLQLAGFYYVGSFRNVGLIIASFILMIVITLFFVIKNQEIMNFSHKI